MDNIKELENKLEEAKRKKLRKNLESTLKTNKQSCNIGYASHSLNTYMNKNKESFHFNMIYITDSVIENDRVYFLYDEVDVFKLGDNFRVTTQRNLRSERVPYIIGSKRHNITKEQFEHFYNKFLPQVESYLDELRFDYKAGNLVSQGDYSNQRTKYELLLKKGNKFIKLDKHERVWELLRWNNHPYVFNEFLLISEESFELIITIANEMMKNASSWGGSIYSRDYPRAERLREFYLKYKHLVKNKEKS